MSELLRYSSRRVAVVASDFCRALCVIYHKYSLLAYTAANDIAAEKSLKIRSTVWRNSEAHAKK